MSRALIAIGTLVALTGAAQAETTVAQQADALYRAWMEADTPQNRALARQQGKPLEAIRLTAAETRTPPVQGQQGFPIFKRQEREGLMSGRAGKAGTLYYWDYKGPATLMITADGPAYRAHRGFRTIAKYWTGRVNKNNEPKYSKPRALHWPLPKLLAQAMPKTAKRFGAWRARRMLRKAVKAGAAPSAGLVKRYFTRAKQSSR